MTVARRLTPALPRGRASPDFEALRKRAETEPNIRRLAQSRRRSRFVGWRRSSERGPGRLHSKRPSVDPKNAPVQFRLGVCYRRRYESQQRQPGDFQAAIDSWSRALDLDPNQYIWRRRIQQYGPRLDKPYAFYDWVNEAEKRDCGPG